MFIHFTSFVGSCFPFFFFNNTEPLSSEDVKKKIFVPHIFFFFNTHVCQNAYMWEEEGYKVRNESFFLQFSDSCMFCTY